MVTVQHPAVAAAFWQPPSHTHHHIFAFPATPCASLVPQWHPSSCMSVSSHTAGRHHTPSQGKLTPIAGGGGSLGQALASSAAFLAVAPQPPQPPVHPPPSHVLLHPQSFTAAPRPPVSHPAAIATLDPEQPIGYGSFGVVWYVCCMCTRTNQPTNHKLPFSPFLSEDSATCIYTAWV